MMDTKTMITTLLVCLAGSYCSSAATLTVERDGGGDYSVIQDAVDAAADGDTLQIGPGRFEQYRRHDLGVWQDQIIHVLLNGRTLTMIGSGEGNTVIGQTSEFPITEHDKGIVLINGAELYLSDLTLERHYMGLESWDTSIVEVKRCAFQHHSQGYGVGAFSAIGGHYDDCRFVDLDVGILPANGSVGVEISGCWFERVVSGVSTSTTLELVVNECTIYAESEGVMLWASSTAYITNVEIYSDGVALILKDGSYGVVADSIMRSDDDRSLMVINGSAMEGAGNIISSQRSPTIDIRRSNLVLEGSHIITPVGYAVYCGAIFLDDWTIDLRNNWWGVSDADSIDALIYDGNDDPNIGVIVDYLPFRDQQVANENLGWGDLKRLYR